MSTYRFCHPNGFYTLEQLFKKGRVRALRRTLDANGHAVFYIHEYWNPRYKSGSGWKLRDPKLVIKAIKLAKKHNLILYGSNNGNS